MMKKNKMKRLAAIMITGALAASFTACGDDAQSTEKVSVPLPEATTAQSIWDKAASTTETEELWTEHMSEEEQIAEPVSEPSGMTVAEIMQAVTETQKANADKTISAHMTMDLDMDLIYQGKPESSGTVNMMMDVKANKQASYANLSMKTADASDIEDVGMEYEYWVDNTKSPVAVYMHMYGAWYKGLDSTGMPTTFDMNAYTNLDPDTYQNTTITETATEYIIQGKINANKIAESGLNVSDMSTIFGNLSEIPTTITIDKAKMYTKRVEMDMGGMSFDKDGATYKINKFTMTINMDEPSDETLTIPQEAIDTAIDMGSMEGF